MMNVKKYKLANYKYNLNYTIYRYPCTHRLYNIYKMFKA